MRDGQNLGGGDGAGGLVGVARVRAGVRGRRLAACFLELLEQACELSRIHAPALVIVEHLIPGAYTRSLLSST